DYLDEVKESPVGSAFDYLYSLHASAFVDQAVPGDLMWTYILRYADGATEAILIRLGMETGDWRAPKELPGATVGWVGAALKLRPVGLYVATLKNPNPAKEVASIDIQSAKPAGVSGIIALTTGKRIS
ncbi:MAG: hypothetical protein NTW86_00440, partial [Candidatus Sumerlaeota bacterium]|nr:hypothetical protein [Candidatus Sumerlaeota bacterium]